jgi:pantoate--beta-alanine ligase
MRLTREEREMAVVIYAVLIRLRDAFGTTDVDASISAAWTQMEQAGLRPEYIEIVDGLTLKPIRKAGDSDYVVACVAAWAGRVRLIDNILIRGEPGL